MTRTLWNTPIWELWGGRTVTRNGETYIATTDAQWASRLKIWRAHLDDGCPCPMPEGHLMFDGVTARRAKR